MWMTNSAIRTATASEEASRERRGGTRPVVAGWHGEGWGANGGREHVWVPSSGLHVSGTEGHVRWCAGAGAGGGGGTGLWGSSLQENVHVGAHAFIRARTVSSLDTRTATYTGAHSRWLRKCHLQGSSLPCRCVYGGRVAVHGDRVD